MRSVCASSVHRENVISKTPVTGELQGVGSQLGPDGVESGGVDAVPIGGGAFSVAVGSLEEVQPLTTTATRRTTAKVANLFLMVRRPLRPNSPDCYYPDRHRTLFRRPGPR